MRFLLWLSLLVVAVFAFISPTARTESKPVASTLSGPPSDNVDLSWMNPAASSTTVLAVPSTTTTLVTPLSFKESFVVDGAVWDALAKCEANGDWAANTGNGFGGGLQFMHQDSYSSWISFGGLMFASDPWLASRDEQIIIGQKIFDVAGWQAWPGCSKKLGLE